LRRVRIRGYKSIAFCDVALQPFTLLVGRNGAGKSNFLDALAFVRDAVKYGVREAVQMHGGMRNLAHRSNERGAVGIELEVSLPHPSSSSVCLIDYRFRVQADTRGIPHLESERLRTNGTGGEAIPEFDRSFSEFTPLNPAAVTPYLERMFQQNKEFGHLLLPVHDTPVGFRLIEGLKGMRLYNFYPEAIRRLQRPNPGTPLERDGSNLASVIEDLERTEPVTSGRAKDYLSVISEDIESFRAIRYGDWETVQFQMRSDAPASPLRLDAAGMSDGTLRALAALMAVFQTPDPTGPSVVGIEEPETSLHPAATGALVDALQEATERTQVLLTTHSADLLADPELDPAQVLVVRNRGGQTHITPVDAASREIVRKELSTLADLQRMDQLDLDEADLKRQAEMQAGEKGE
jgi:predicted ATPase